MMKRIQRGPVRGISLKLQEEERERRMDFVPEVSAIDIENIEVDKDTQAMLRALELNINGVTVAENDRRGYNNRRGDNNRGDRRGPRRQ